MRQSRLVPALVAVLLLTSLTGCKKLTSATEATPTTPPPAVTGTAAPTGLAVAVKGTQATVTWTPPRIGAALRSYELALDGARAVPLPASARSRVLTGLKPGSHSVQLVAVSAKGRSLPVTASFLVALGERPRTAAPAPTIAPRVQGPAPTGQLVIDAWQRLAQDKQTKYGCDRILITLANRSSKAIASQTVTFATTWFEEAYGPPPAKEGRAVAVTQRTVIPVGATRDVLFDVCLPEKKTKHVFGEPTGIRWTWAS